MNASKDMRGDKRQVEREIYYRVRVLDDPLRHLVARSRHDGNQDRRLRKFLAKLFDQRTRRDDLSDRGGVHPNAILLCHRLERLVGNYSETLPNPLDEALLSNRADHEHRYNEDHDDDCRDVVE